MKAGERNEFRRDVFKLVIADALRTTADGVDRTAGRASIAKIAVAAALEVANLAVAAIDDAESGATAAQRGEFLARQDDAAALLAEYNAARHPTWAEAPSPPPAELLSRIRGALARGPLEAWRERLMRAVSSDQLCNRGRMPMQMKVNLAWLLQPNTVGLLDAGHFDNGQTPADAKVARMATDVRGAADILREREERRAGG